MSDPIIAQICAAAGRPKFLAQLTGASQSTARRWQADGGMPAAALIRAARRCAAVREALLAALGLDDAACLARLDAIDAALASLKARKDRRHALAALDAHGVNAARPGSRAGRDG
jgi:hypothetical protein